jgi:hypothetical protein
MENFSHKSLDDANKAREAAQIAYWHAFHDASGNYIPKYDAAGNLIPYTQYTSDTSDIKPPMSKTKKIIIAVSILGGIIFLIIASFTYKYYKNKKINGVS